MLNTDFSNFPLKNVTPQFVVHYQNLVLDEVSEGYATERQGCALGSLIPRLHFSCHQKNGSGQLPTTFSFKCTGMLVYCNLMLDIIEDCIPHCVPNKMNVDRQP